MSILSFSDFSSSAYRDVSWKDIFCSAGSAVSGNAEPMGLVNRKNVIMVPDYFHDIKNIKLSFPGDHLSVIGGDILYKPLPNSLIAGVVFLAIKTKNKIEMPKNTNTTYIYFLSEIIFKVQAACNTIFKYTYDHLSHRSIGKCVVSKIPVIQHDFTVVYLTLEKLEIAVKNVACIDDVAYCLSLSIEALHILSRLSGARSVICNRAIELIYHLKIFQRFILDGNDIIDKGEQLC